MDDRIERLQQTAERLSREVSELRHALAELRSGDGAGEHPVAGDRSAEQPTSRIEAFNAAMAGRAAEPAPTLEAATESRPGGTRPADNWNDVLKSLGIGGGPRVAPTARHTPAVERGLEDLVGRYGTIGLASITILMGVGALVGWAIRNGLISPMVRVVLGLVAALVVAFFGWRVRRGDSPRFGNALLALALAIVHVVSWGAGPRLQLIDTPTVLALAALSSAALASLAWREDDQVLFNIGFGGALLAPFVTSDGSGHPVLLLSYGFVVLLAGIASLAQRSWTRTPFVASFGILLYTASAVALVSNTEPWAARSAAGAFALGLSAMSSMLLDGKKRMAITYPSLVAAFGAMLKVAGGTTVNPAQYPFTVALTLAGFVAGDRALRGLRTSIVGAILLPAGSTALALGTLPQVVSLRGVGTALLFAALSTIAAWKDLTGDRRTHAFSATALVGLAVALATDDRQLLFCLALAAFAMATAVAARRLRLGGIAAAGGLGLAVATVRAFEMLARRATYDYTPFVTEASVAAAAVSLAWIILSFQMSRYLAPSTRRDADLSTTFVRLIGATVAFFWVREEVARAVSPDVSAFLVIAWYAVSGVASIFVGHARRIPLLRQLGLGLSVLAALTTIAQASSLIIGWRVASYLLAGTFLLGVAYSYRITKPRPVDATRHAPEADAPVIDPA